jgi:hypothetical protein
VGWQAPKPQFTPKLATFRTKAQAYTRGRATEGFLSHAAIMTLTRGNHDLVKKAVKLHLLEPVARGYHLRGKG